VDYFVALRSMDAEAFFQLTPLPLAVTDSNGKSLLQEAIFRDKQDIALRLIAMGVPLDVQDNRGLTALQYALDYEQGDVARAIIERGADVNLTDAAGNNAVWTAVMSSNGDYGLVKLLVDKGADLNNVNKANRSVLDLVKQFNTPPLFAACGLAADA